MTEFTEMHIFFAVTTAIVVVVGALIGIILVRVMRILGHVERITKMAADEGALVRDDIMELRHRLKEEALKFSGLVDFFRGRLEKMAGKRASRKTKVTNHKEEEYGEKENG